VAINIIASVHRKYCNILIKKTVYYEYFKIKYTHCNLVCQVLSKALVLMQTEEINIHIYIYFKCLNLTTVTT